MEPIFNIVDFKAVTKHAYYSGSDIEGVYCEKTDKHYNTWQFGAQKLLERYSDAWFQQDSPRHLIVAHDMGREYRTSLFPNYKGKKDRDDSKDSPVELEQVEHLQTWAKKFFSAIGATQIGVDGVEADDVIAWLCQGLKGYSKQVFTVDADLLQLVDDETSVYLKMEPHFQGGSFHDIPYHLTSVSKSMLGDTSDKYVGVRGFGKTAYTKLISEFGEDVIEELQQIVDTADPTALDEAIEATQSKELIKLREKFSEWVMAWKLARLHPELCWMPKRRKLTKPTIHKRVADGDKCAELLRQAGAEDYVDQFEEMMPRYIAVDANNWEEMRDDIFEEIKKGNITALDYETHDYTKHAEFMEASASGENFVDMLSHTLTGGSFTFGQHLENSIYVPVDHADTANLPRSVLKEILEFAAEHTQLVVQNAMFEGVISKTNLGMDLQGVHDTRIMQRYLNENDEAGLKAMSKAYLNYDQASYRETVGDKGGMADLTLEEVFDYGIDDSMVTGSIYDLLKLMLLVDHQWDFYQRWSVRPTEVLQHSYVNGVDVNWRLQKEVHANDIAILEECRDKLHAVLRENVTGDITSGCRSFIEEERDYVLKSNRRKLKEDGLSGKELAKEVTKKVEAWEAKMQNACIYVPYSEQEVMPAFSPSPKQLSEAAVALGLDPIEKTSDKALNAYLDQYGMIGLDDPRYPEDPAQQEFLLALCQAYTDRAFKLSDLVKKSQAAAEEEAVNAEKLEREVEAASAAKTRLGEVTQRASGVEPKLVKTGDELSFGSPQQMQQLLYCKIGVPVRLRSKGALGKGRMTLGFRENGPATDEDAILTALANDVEEGSWQQEALNLVKRAKSSLTKITLYHQKYPLWVHPKDGKVHPTFTYCGTDTLRPTGSSPNMLQVSKKDKEMRQMFVPPSKDWVTVAIDYASQEIRLMACEANDPVMKSVYDPANEKDLHSMTGSGIAKMDYDSYIEARGDTGHKLHPMVEAIRKKAKQVNFGLAYGAGAGTLSRTLIVPFDEAKTLLDGALGLYTRIKPWQAETGEFMEKYGYTLTAFGNKRHATDDIFSNDKGKVARQHRQGTNSTIQGTAADMLSIVLTLMAERDLINKLRMVFFAPIYDEVVSFVHKDDVVAYCREMLDIMSSATPPTHEIPQVPEFSIGATWGSVKELGRWPGEEAIEKATAEALVELEEIWDRDMEAA